MGMLCAFAAAKMSNASVHDRKRLRKKFKKVSENQDGL